MRAIVFLSTFRMPRRRCIAQDHRARREHGVLGQRPAACAVPRSGWFTADAADQPPFARVVLSGLFGPPLRDRDHAGFDQVQAVEEPGDAGAARGVAGLAVAA